MRRKSAITTNYYQMIRSIAEIGKAVATIDKLHIKKKYRINRKMRIWSQTALHKVTSPLRCSRSGDPLLRIMGLGTSLLCGVDLPVTDHRVLIHYIIHCNGTQKAGTEVINDSEYEGLNTPVYNQFIS